MKHFQNWRNLKNGLFHRRELGVCMFLCVGCFCVGGCVRACIIWLGFLTEIESLVSMPLLFCFSAWNMWDLLLFNCMAIDDRSRGTWLLFDFDFFLPVLRYRFTDSSWIGLIICFWDLVFLTLKNVVDNDAVNDINIHKSYMPLYVHNVFHEWFFINKSVMPTLPLWSCISFECLPLYNRTGYWGSSFLPHKCCCCSSPMLGWIQ